MFGIDSCPNAQKNGQITRPTQIRVNSFKNWQIYIFFLFETANRVRDLFTIFVRKLSVSHILTLPIV